MAGIQELQPRSLSVFPLLLLVLSTSQAWAVVGVTGAVQDSEGNPISGAKVSLEWLRSAAPYGDMGNATLDESGNESRVLQAQTDGNGAFRLENVGGGIGRVRVRAQGLVSAESVPFAVFRTLHLKPLVLRSRLERVVSIRDVRGTAVGAAEVRIQLDTSPRSFWTPTPKSAITNEDGIAKIEVPSHLRYRLVAFREGLGETSLQGGAEELIVMTQSEPHQIRWRENSGQFVERVQISLGAGDWELDPTDERGASWIPIPAEPVGTAVSLRWSSSDGRQGKVLVGSTTDLVQLPRRFCRKGRLIDGRTGNPVPRGFVWLEPTPIRFVRSDSAGKFEICGESETMETVRLRAGADGFAESDQPAPTKVAAVGSWPLVRAVTVIGQVVDQEGQPLSEARVFAFDTRHISIRDGLGRPTARPNGMTDPEGLFAVDGLREDGTTFLHVFLDDRPPAVLKWTKEVGSEIRVVMSDPTAIRGVVLESDTRTPLAGAMLFVSSESQRSSSSSIFTGPDGRFRIPQPNDSHEPIEITVRKPGYASWTKSNIGFGENTSLEIVLEQSAVFQGTVKDPQGRPVEGVLLQPISLLARVAPIAGLYLSGRTDENGQFRLDTLPAGEIEIAISHPSFRRTVESVVLEPGATSLADIELYPMDSFEVKGRVLTPPGALGKDTAISIVPREGGIARRSELEPGGGFSIPDVPAGRYRVLVIGSDLLIRPGDEELLVSTGNASVELEMIQAARVTGQIIGLEFADLVDCEVWAVGRVHRIGRFDEGSREFEVAGLSPGTWRIEARLRNSAQGFAETVKLEAGESVDIRLELGLTHQLSGEILVDGQPLQATVILARPSVGEIRRAEADATGFFRFSDVGEGSFEVSVLGVGKRNRYAQSVYVGKDQHLSLDLTPSSVLGSVVSSESGESLPDAIIALTLLNEEGSPVGLPRSARSDKDGRFTIGELVPGRWRLDATIGSESVYSGFLALESGETREIEIPSARPVDLSLVLVAEARVHEVMLKFTGDEGLGWQERRILGSENRLSVKSVPAGLWVIEAWTSSGLASPPVVVEHIGPSVVELPMSYSGSLEILAPEWIASRVSGTISLASGLGVSRGKMIDGRAHFPQLHPGDWTVEIEVAGEDSWSDEIVVTEGRLTRVIVNP